VHEFLAATADFLLIVVSGWANRRLLPCRSDLRGRHLPERALRSDQVRCIVAIVRAAFTMRGDKRRAHELHGVTEGQEPPRPLVRPTAGFHADQAPRSPRHEFQQQPVGGCGLPAPRRLLVAHERARWSNPPSMSRGRRSGVSAAAGRSYSRLRALGLSRPNLGSQGRSVNVNICPRA